MPKPFREQKFCQQIQHTSLNITPEEWLMLEKRFHKENYVKVTKGFLLNALSDIRKVPVQSLLLNITETRNQPEREAKRVRESEVEGPISFKKSKYYHKDEGENALIYEADKENSTLQANLKDKGVRITTLENASPEKGHPFLKRTESGRKVRPVSNINNHCFFKALTPEKPTNEISKEQIKNALPKTTYELASPISFNVTYQNIMQAAGKSRGRSAKAIKGHSANDFFDAHGLNESPTKKSKNKHFHHLHAHCLGGPQQFDNLIPGTAESNYNTFKLVEKQSLDILADKKTELVQTKVVPSYTDNSLIPYSLTYTTDYVLNNPKPLHFKEIVYIQPKSTYLYNRKEIESINTLREDIISQHSMKT